jgi:hypothetical protein
MVAWVGVAMAMASLPTSGLMMKGGIDMKWLCKVLGHNVGYVELANKTEATWVSCARCGEKFRRVGEQDVYTEYQEQELIDRVKELERKATNLESWVEGREYLEQYRNHISDVMHDYHVHWDADETRRYFGLGNGMGHKHKVTYVIHDKTINPTIWVDGEEMAIVSCDYHYVTRSGEGNPGESILTATVVHHTTDPTQHVVSINQQTGQVFYQ